MSGESNDNENVRTWAYGLLAGLLFLELFLFVWCRSQCTQRGYEVTAAQIQTENLLGKQEELKVKLEHLKNPDRISKIAKERFGLAHPGPNQLMRP
ncbi:MAG: septum formation initiator family protein [Desulfatibacillum sp.]|nr:septum formation initiator family protein [Desulfatibacillum sp.]